MNFIKRYTSFVEKIVITTLIFLMSIILVFSTFELLYSLFNGFFKSGTFISLDTLMDVFGGFLLILIGVELLETIKIYLNQSVVHVEVVVLVAIIALARKIVILKIEEISIEVTAGIAILVFSLSLAYYLIKKSGILVLSVDNKKSKVEKVKEQDNDKLSI